MTSHDAPASSQAVEQPSIFKREAFMPERSGLNKSAPSPCYHLIYGPIPQDSPGCPSSPCSIPPNTPNCPVVALPITAIIRLHEEP